MHVLRTFRGGGHSKTPISEIRCASVTLHMGVAFRSFVAHGRRGLCPHSFGVRGAASQLPEHGPWSHAGLMDPVLIWKRRMPLIQVLTGRPKGRTIAALKKEVRKLKAEDETLDDSNRLAEYLRQAICVDQIRPKNLVRLPPRELQEIVGQVVKADVQLPPIVMKTILEYRITTCLRENSHAELIEVAFPWPTTQGPVVFDALKPTVATIGWTLSASIASFRRAVFGRLLTPLLSSGEEKVKAVDDIMADLWERFDAVDLVEAKAAAAALTGEVLSVVKVVRALIVFPINGEIQPDFDAMESAKISGGHGLLATVAATLVASKWWEHRWTTLRKMMPVLCEIGDKMENIMQMEEDAVFEMTEEGLATLQDSLKIAVHARAASLLGDLIGPLTARLHKIFTASAKFDKLVNLGPNAEKLLSAFAEALQTATQAFPTDMTVLELQRDLQKSRILLASASLTAALLQSIKNAPGKITIAEIEIQRPLLQSVIDCAAECVGLVIPSECAMELRKYLGVLASGFSDALREYHTDTWELTHQVAEALVACSENSNDLGLVRFMGLAIALKTSVCDLVLTGGVDAPITDATWDLLQKICVASSQCAGFSDKQFCVEIPSAQRVVADVDAAVADAHSMTTTLRACFVAKRLQDMQAAEAMATATTSGLLDGDVWYKGVKPKDWKTLEETARKKLEALDLKSMEMLLERWDTAKTAYQDILQTTGFDESETNLVKSQDLLRKFVILKVQASLMWHLRSETSHEALRKKVKQEVLLLRRWNMIEKDELPLALFLKSNEALKAGAKVSVT